VYTILLVEDNLDTGRLMRLLFELEGYRVIFTNDYEFDGLYGPIRVLT
jgi:CheY-like chemotaxis protein